MAQHKLLTLAVVILLMSVFGRVNASDEKPMPIAEIKLNDSLRRIILPKEDTSIVALTGPDGILLVDDGAKESMPELKSRLEAFKSGPVRYIILTHWHPDHVQGIQLIGKETTVLAHSHTREMLAHDQVLTGLPPIKSHPADKLPRITIDSSVKIYFDGEIIEIMPLPGGHSGGDMVVYFKKANILDIGDLIQSDIFPFCDIDHGGNLAKLAENIGKVIATMPPNVRIIPAHGREYTRDDLKKYKEMIEGVMDIVREEMRKGKTLDEMKAADVLKDYKSWATQWRTCNDIIDYAYKSHLVQEEFTFDSSIDNVGPFRSLAVYPEGAQKFPIMVLQPGYNGGRDLLLFSAKRMAARGYFCICNGRRGKAGQPGQHDDGGMEIMDIYDSIQTAIMKYGDKVDGSRISIAGYSNGGGNVFSVIVRFPYLFRGGLAFFGIPDYGKWASTGHFTKDVVAAIGGTPEQVPDKYMVRNACLASGNLRGARFHIAYDEKETTCPISMDEAFVEAAKKAGYENIFVHVSKANDQQRWLHGYNGDHDLSPMEDIFMDDIEKHPMPPKMAPSGEFTVPGFLVTPLFTCFLGRGDDAVAKIKYQIADDSAKFEFNPVSSNPNAPAQIILHQKPPHKEVSIIVNGKKTAVIKEGEPLKAETTINGSLEFAK